MTRLVLLVVLCAVAACAPSREERCKATRDKVVPLQEANVQESLAGADPQHRDAIAAQGAKEVALFKARFVDSCVKHAKIDLSCFDDKDKGRTKECKEQIEPMWKEIYGQ